MAIPDFESIMLPLLVHLSDGRERQARDTVDALADEFGLSESERRELLPSGKQALFTNRVAWAKFYLKKAGAVENPRRGFYQITAVGRELIKSNPTKIGVPTLHRLPSFLEFEVSSRGAEEGARTVAAQLGQDHAVAPANDVRSDLSPEELLEFAHSRLHGQLAADLITVVKQASPEFFERLVVDLLLALGYGGSRVDAGKTVGRSGDGGIDGIINEDRLGLDVIYIQAKRWEGVVGRPEIQKFAGALQGQRARKGIFITTSDFTREALDFVKSIETKIVLIDGKLLARLMIEHNVGVNPESIYHVKRIDTDYFVEE